MGVSVTKAPKPLALRLGTKIQKLRKTRGMKQDTLAMEAGYGSRSAIASIENGLVVPSVEKVLDIARALGVQPGTLLEESDVPESESAWLVTVSRMALSLPYEHRQTVAGMLEALASELKSSTTRTPVVAQLTPFFLTTGASLVAV